MVLEMTFGWIGAGHFYYNNIDGALVKLIVTASILAFTAFVCALLRPRDSKDASLGVRICVLIAWYGQKRALQASKPDCSTIDQVSVPVHFCLGGAGYSENQQHGADATATVGLLFAFQLVHVCHRVDPASLC